MIYEGPEPDKFGVWPENWMSVEVFSAMNTQWNIHPMGGHSGLRYEALPVVMSCCGVRKSQRREVFSSLRIMEQTALELLRRKR